MVGRVGGVVGVVVMVGGVGGVVGVVARVGVLVGVVVVVMLQAHITTVFSCGQPTSCLA